MRSIAWREAYDASMSSEERRSINNAIWLCKACAWLIDQDETTYTVELLHQWKSGAEKSAYEEFNKPTYSEEMVRSTIKSALNPYPLKVISAAVKHVAQAEEEMLTELDPAFAVKVAYQEGRTTYSIYPKKPVSAKFTIHSDKASEFSQQMRALIEHGKKVDFDASYLQISGSPLLEKISAEAQGGRLLINSGIRKQAVLKVALVNPDTSEHYSMDNVLGEITGGSKSLTFSGSSMSGIFECTLTKSFDEEGRFRSTLGVDYLKWNKKPIRLLPYFDKVWKFLESCRRGFLVEVELEVDGNLLMSGRGDGFQGSEKLYLLVSFLHYCRVISKHIDIHPIFSDEIAFSDEDFRQIKAVAEAIRGEYYCDFSENDSVIDAELIFDTEEAIDAINDPANPDISIQFNQNEVSRVSIFGVKADLPRLSFDVKNVHFKEGISRESVKLGEPVSISFLAGKNCTCSAQVLAVEKQNDENGEVSSL